VTARSPKAVLPALINNDSFVDLVIVTYGYEGDDTSEVIVLINDGSGNFTPLRQSISGRGLVDVEVANFGNDSTDEIVVASYDGTVRIYDFSSGSLSQLVSLTTQVGIESIAARDLNRDGLVDLVIANSKAETIELFIDGPSGFTRNRTITGVPSPSDIAIGNFDNDGILDVAVTNLYGGVGPNYTLPSSVTILGLTVSEREITFTANQTATANFGFVSTPLTALSATQRDFDVDRNGTVSGRDALEVINAMSRSNRGEGEALTHVRGRKLDVNGDGKVTAQDALLIINHMSRQRRASKAAGEQLAASADTEQQKRDAAVDAVMADSTSLF
jgi:Dockerin type I domain/FG-GAP-like repeat